MAFFVQKASKHLPSTELVCIRAVFQGGLTLFGMSILPAKSDAQGSKGRALIKFPFGGTPEIRRVVLARGAVGGFGFVVYYYTMSALPLGDAVALVSLKSILTVICGWLFLGEALKPTHLIAAFSSVTGAMLIARPTFLFGVDEDWHGAALQKARPLGYFTAMLGACCGTAVFLLIRRSGKLGVHTLQLMISWAMFGIMFSVLFGKFLCGPGRLMGDIDGGEWRLLDSKEVWWDVFAVCILGSGAHFFMNYAVRIAPAGLSSIVKSSEMVWAYIWQVLLFHQVPSGLTVVGVLMICGSLVTIAVQKMFDEKSMAAMSAGEGTRLVEGNREKEYTTGDEEEVDVEMHEHRIIETGSNYEGMRPAGSGSSLTALLS